MITPCYQCMDRHAGCHGACEKYSGWKEQHEKKKAEEHEEDLKRQDLAAARKAKYRRLKR